ncbi:hypothetical protein ABPG72_003021 [Tetrahymena utriculariae]
MNSIEDIEYSLRQDGYIDLQLIHKGTYSVLLEANSLKQKNNVCLKISKESELDYQMMMNEFIILNRIQNISSSKKSDFENNNIVQVIEFLDYSKFTTCIIVQELCQQNLEEEIINIRQQNKFFTSEEINTIFIHMINGINHIHSHRIIHCDIKPANILKSQQGIYKICDFDLSTSLDQFQDSTNFMKGYTKCYMSPEQEEWNSYQSNNQQYKIEITQKSDVFNLGIVFLEVLGEQINDSNSQQIRQGDYFFNSQVIESQWFQKVLMMIKPNPHERIHSSQLYGLLYPLELFSFQNYENLENIFNYTFQKNCYSQNTDFIYLLNSNLNLAVVFERIVSSEKYQNIYLLAMLNQYISYVQCFLGDYQSCLSHCIKSIKYYEQIYLYQNKFIEQIIILHLQASDLQILLGDVQQSINQSQSAFDLTQKLNLRNSIHLYGLVLVYKSRQLRLISKLEESLEIGLQSLQILQKGNCENVVLSLLEVAQTYEQIGELKQSLECRKNAIKMVNINKILQNSNIPFLYHKIVITYQNLQQTNKYFKKVNSINMRDQINLQMIIAQNLISQGNKLLFIQ